MVSSPDPVQLLRMQIERACRVILDWQSAERDKHEEKVRAAQRIGQEPPKADLPRCTDPWWVLKAARMLAKQEVGGWLRNEDVVEGFQDLAGPVFERLLEWPEFVTWRDEVVEVRWTTKAVVRKDLTSAVPLAGRPKVVPVADREAWTGEGKAPSFRAELSLPWWLLAEDDEMERGLHDVIAAFGVGERGPVLRKPDIVAHASTLARFGVSDIREATAVFHAQRHPTHERRLRDFGFDAVTGQGEMWSPHGPRQGDIREAAKMATTTTTRSRKDRASDPEA